MQVNQEMKKKETKIINLRHRDDDEAESDQGSDDSDDED